ncbi:hypothetical protein HK102_003919, partial [Quaeritorhiza haematococci]
NESVTTHPPAPHPQTAPLNNLPNDDMDMDIDTFEQDELEQNAIQPPTSAAAFISTTSTNQKNHKDRSGHPHHRNDRHHLRKPAMTSSNPNGDEKGAGMNIDEMDLDLDTPESPQPNPNQHATAPLTRDTTNIRVASNTGNIIDNNGGYETNKDTDESEDPLLRVEDWGVPVRVGVGVLMYTAEEALAVTDEGDEDWLWA